MRNLQVWTSSKSIVWMNCCGFVSLREYRGSGSLIVLDLRTIVFVVRHLLIGPIMPARIDTRATLRATAWYWRRLARYKLYYWLVPSITYAAHWCLLKLL
jgi:hypothetical protein